MFGLKKRFKPIRTNDPILINEQMVGAWMGASEERDDPVFNQIFAVLDELRKSDPVRVWAMKRDLEWLRKQAGKKGIRWGVG